MSFSTAYSKLLKKILFNVLKENKKNICWRCKSKIKDIKSLSIEHKKSWESSNNPIQSFLDFKNIAFSHLKCNLRAKKLSKIPSSGFRGVVKSDNPRAKKIWKVVLRVNKKDKHFGRHETARQAAEIYDKMAIKYFGKQAITNKKLGIL